MIKGNVRKDWGALTGYTLGVADTTFSRVDMFPFVEKAIGESGFHFKVERYTVPGIKDLPVACKRLLLDYKCDIVIALGMVGKEKIDKQCSHEASSGIQHVQLETMKHILEVFIHMDEATDDRELFSIARNRAYKHTLNAIALLKGKNALTPRAGQGLRQGKGDAGPVQVKQ